jgi:uncharacterized protein (TIGR00725 family)
VRKVKATSSSRIYLAVVGPSLADDETLELAEELGAEVARAGAVLLTGGMGGAMEAACRGAAREGGLTVGILPGASRDDGNAYLSVSIPTGMGEMRNALLVRSADAVIAVGGGVGTLSEIALALKLGKPLAGIRSWQAQVDGSDADIPDVALPREAVATVLRSLSDAAGPAVEPQEG